MKTNQAPCDDRLYRAVSERNYEITGWTTRERAIRMAEDHAREWREICGRKVAVRVYYQSGELVHTA